MASPRGLVAKGNVSGAVTLDAAQGSVFTATLIGNVTIAVKNVTITGGPVLVLLTQDETGSRTVSWAGAGGQSVSGFTTVSSTAGSTSSFLLWSTNNDNTTLQSVANPSSSGGSVSSSWEQLLVTGSVLSKTTPKDLAGAGALSIDVSVVDTFSVGPLVNNATLAVSGIRAGHTYVGTYYQAVAGEAAFTLTITPTPLVGDLQGLTNVVNPVIGGSSVRQYYSPDGTNLYIVGGDDFSP